MERADVLVVGGGPAGSSLAFGLRGAGLDVVVLDGAAFPRHKTCAGWVTPPVWSSLGVDPDAYGRGRTLQAITGFRIRRVGDREAHVHCGAPVSYGILRCEFDQFLLGRCGARLLLGERVESIERDRAGARWVVNGRIAARVLVGAGGHFCPVARSARPAGAARETTVLALESEYALSDAEAAACPVDPAVPELFFTADLEGYGWIFRKGRHLNVGLGRRDPSRLREHLARFVDFLCAEGRLSAPPAASFRGHGYLLYEDAPRPLSGEGFALVGDAAGLAHGRSGEGIRPAVESGLLAARAIAGAGARPGEAGLGDYARAVERRFGCRGARPGPGLTGVLPVAWTRRLAGQLLSRPRFARGVVVDRWFLNRGQAPLAAAP